MRGGLFAAYAALVDLFPAQQSIYAQQMAALGYVTNGSDTGLHWLSA